MSALASLKRNWLLAALVLLCALTVFAAFVAPSEIGKMELELEASTAATRIGAELNGEPGTLADAFARPALAPHLSGIFEKLGYDHRVLRYELYDHAGNLSFASVKAGLTFDPSVDGAPRVTSKRGTHRHAAQPLECRRVAFCGARHSGSFERRG